MADKLDKGQNDPKRFIRKESCTIDGELAQYNSYSLNQEMIDQEARFDGFAGFRTDTQIVSKQKMKKIITETKKSSIKDNGK